MLIGLILGAVIGAVVTLLYAPIDRFALREVINTQITRLKTKPDRVRSSISDGREIVRSRLLNRGE